MIAAPAVTPPATPPLRRMPGPEGLDPSAQPAAAPRSRRIWPHASLGVLMLAAGLLGCAPKDVYWTRAGASESQFRSASRRCSESAILALAEERGESCTYNSGAGGSICSSPNPSDPFQVEAEKKRKKRRLAYLYGECLQGRGWTPNTEGNGHKGRY